ncbi:SRPBCC family protein [Nonomuraea sp. NPDC050680]|uniref:SRPBCC family protein n=1 Tax=Nonomuraea sp. NPDC050680 TaxID=3154630 RepID=UPI0033F3DB51
MRTIDTRVYELASAGAVDMAAPAIAGGAIDIDAPREVVWDALAQVENWPGIRADVSDVEPSGPTESGSSFTWSAGGAPVTSAFALVERASRLTWVTTAPGFSMAAVYEFDDLGFERTRIRCQESMDAAAVAPHIDHDVLAGLIRSWLEGIKAFVETQPVPR